MLGVPVALAVGALWIDQPGLLPFAALWVVVQLVELARPGGGEELAKSASNAQKLSSPPSPWRSG